MRRGGHLLYIPLEAVTETRLYFKIILHQVIAHKILL